MVIILGDAPESRIKHALRIYAAAKAPRILISGGSFPWRNTSMPEAERIANILVELGVPRSSLTLETHSRTTRENAVNTAAIFRQQGWQTGILVTSGFHMPRAFAAFASVGMRVVPASGGSSS